MFSDGSFIGSGLVCQKEKSGAYRIIQNERQLELTDSDWQQLTSFVEEFRHMANLLLTSDYYKQENK